MEKETVSWFNDSIYTKPLSPACKMCALGSKMVVLVTGLCPASCFYCPLSQGKLGKDRIFADEWELTDENDVEKLISEAEYIEAAGAGITGGDPLMVWKRTKKYIKLLKNHFGSNFHIHLYTSGAKNGEFVEELVTAGLDEIRFHPAPVYWNEMDKFPFCKVIKNSVNADCDVAFEIPVIPEKENEILSLIRWADEHNVKWVNLNELEFSETNAEKLTQKSFTVKDDISAAVLGSQKTAYTVVENSLDLEIGVHYCSSSFKDGIQLTNRIKRRAKNIAKAGDVVTKDGTLLKGVVYSSKKTLKQIYNLLLTKFKINEKYLFIDKEKNRVEVASWILEKIFNELKKHNLDCFLVEEYPTADRLEVEKIPLPI